MISEILGVNLSRINKKIKKFFVVEKIEKKNN